MPRNTAFALIALPLALAACGTKQERCIAENTAEYRSVVRLLAETEANLARGYAYEQRVVESSRLAYCGAYRRDRNGDIDVVPVTCWQDYTTTRRYRVAIDPQAEMRKRDNLIARRDELAPQAEAYVEACKRQFPEDPAPATAPAQ